MPEKHSIQILAYCHGPGAALILASIGIYINIEQAGQIPVPAPEGAGLHVWRGTAELLTIALPSVVGPGGQMSNSNNFGSFEGGWSRATAADLENFNMPLSEPAIPPRRPRRRWHFDLQIGADTLAQALGILGSYYTEMFAKVDGGVEDAIPGELTFEEHTGDTHEATLKLHKDESMNNARYGELYQEFLRRKQ